MKIQVLDEAKIERIKTLTEDIIENIGFTVDDEEIISAAAKAGAVIERDNVRIPRALLAELLSTVPSSYTVKGMTGNEYTIGGGKQHIIGIVIDPFIIDYETQQPRMPGMEDVRVNTILNQLNDDVYGMSRMDFPVVEFADATSTWRSLETHLLHHTKHYAVYPTSDRDFFAWVDMAQMLGKQHGVAVGELISAAVPSLSPLALVDINCNILKECTKRNIAVIPTVCPMAGTTSPYSVEGSLLQSNAEIIFIGAMSQILNPGNKFLYAGGPSVSDMRTAHDMYYTVDKALWKTALVELADSYNMPCSAEMGGTLGHRYDMQSGAETMLFMLGAVTSGADILAGLGSCYNANGLSSEMMIIQQEWQRISEFLSKGVSMERIERGYQSIADTGAGGNYLMDDLTIEMLRSDGFYQSELMDVTGGYEVSQSILEKAHARVQALTSDFVSPVPGNTQESIKRYFADIYKRLS
ncbi:MAG: hypothetical protein HN948_01675 [Clostridia bacterium]|jgi:trimethylamine---corrinoid protein Co-methyltransferase|nr:hypothetical protein [Clostridia bacterium]MBT7121699.1 hypothetical protein [Clostridia bacterium]